MGIIYFGSARMGENGKITGGKAGDQKQSGSGLDTIGEVSVQPMYSHKKIFRIIRPIDPSKAEQMAYEMVMVCNNPNYGYNQDDRYGIIKNGTRSKVKTNCDCSSTVRAIVKSVYNIDPGDFNTSNEYATLMKMKLNGSLIFSDEGEYKSQELTPVYNGDILVTKTKGHTGIVCGGSPRSAYTSSVRTALDHNGATVYYDAGIVGLFRVKVKTKLFDAPNANSKILAELPLSSVVECFGWKNGTFAFVSFGGGKVGYVNGLCVTRI